MRLKFNPFEHLGLFITDIDIEKAGKDSPRPGGDGNWDWIGLCSTVDELKRLVIAFSVLEGDGFLDEKLSKGLSWCQCELRLERVRRVTQGTIIEYFRVTVGSK